MPGSVVPVVEPAGIRTVEPLHAARKIRFGSLDHEMEVIVHQHPRRNTPTKTAGGVREERQKCLAIPVGSEDRPTLIAARRDVVDGARKLDTKRSCHNKRQYYSNSLIVNKRFDP